MMPLSISNFARSTDGVITRTLSTDPKYKASPCQGKTKFSILVVTVTIKNDVAVDPIDIVRSTFNRGGLILG